MEHNGEQGGAAPVDALAELFVDAPPLMKIVEVADTLRMSREGIRKWTTERRVASLKFPKGQGPGNWSTATRSCRT